MIARLKYLGMDVRRVHSDAAGEMLGTRRWCEDRGFSTLAQNGLQHAVPLKLREGIRGLLLTRDPSAK